MNHGFQLWTGRKKQELEEGQDGIIPSGAPCKQTRFGAAWSDTSRRCAAVSWQRVVAHLTERKRKAVEFHEMQTKWLRMGSEIADNDSVKRGSGNGNSWLVGLSCGAVLPLLHRKSSLR